MNTECNPHLLSDPSGGGGGGCVIGSGGATSSGAPIHGYGSPTGSHGSSGCVDMGVGTPCPVPTPPWVKPPSNHSNSGMMTPESDVSSCSSPASTSYGASSQQQAGSFPPQQQPHMQQRSFYGSTTNYTSNCAGNANSSGSELTTHANMNQMRGGGGYNNSNAISSSTNNNSGLFYNASGEVIDQSQYYHHQHQQQHFQQQQQFSSNPNNLHLHQQQHKTGSPNCSTPSLDNNVNLIGSECGGDAVDSSAGGNFYGFYNTNQSGQYTDYHVHDLHQHHDTSTGYPGSGSGGGDHSTGNNNRMHPYYRQDGSSASANSVPVGHSGYFNSSTPNPNYSTSSGNSTPTRYGSPMMFPNNHSNYGQQQAHHHHHQNMQGGQMPIRRNSIESYSAEPGDMNSSYTARYGCSNAPVNNANNNMNNHSHTGGISQMTTSHHNSFPTSNTTGGPVGSMIKRECMSNRGSPVMNPMTPNNMNTGCWSPHPPQQGYFPSSSPNSGCTSSSSPNPCSNDGGSGGNRTSFINHNAYNQNICGGEGESGNCANSNFFPPQQQQQHHHQPTQFKSCAYEQSQQHHDIKEGIPSMMMNNNNLKAASAVKHRSLSLSVPLPSYLENNGGSRSDLENTFSNNHRQQLSHHHHQQLHNSNNHNHAFSGMVDHAHHSHQQCTTTGLVPPPEQNLLTPNSDDDIPFRAASASGQSDLDSSYETMGEEGCSSTSTSVASHCMNTSGTSSCSSGGGDNGVTVPMTIATTTEHMHSMSIDANNEQDCQHHHHHHHNHVSMGNDLVFSSSTSVSSCMQTQSHHHLQQHHHVASSIGIGMLELPNSTVALCTNNVDDLDESSTDSSVELHNVISAVVQNSSIETPENTMMGDEDDEVDNVVEGIMRDEDITAESSFHHHHHQDSQADMNVISTTTMEPDELDDDDVVGNHDHDVDDNCSESSMSHINSSFTADMFCDSNHSNDDNSSSEMVIATSNEMNTTSNCDNGEEDANVINSSSGSNDFACVPEEGNFMDNEVEHVDEEENATVNSNVNFDSIKASFSPLGTDSTSISLPSPSSSSPQKISKRSFSETDKDVKTATTSSAAALTTTSTDSAMATLSTTFGAILRKASENSRDSGGVVGSGETTSSISSISSTPSLSAVQKGVKKENSSSSVSSNNTINKEEKSSEDSANITVNSDTNEKSDGSNVNSTDTSSSSNSCSGSFSTTTTTASSSCKAIDIIISSSVNNLISKGSGNNNGNNNRVSIPKGWKREILKGSLNDNGTTANNGTGVLYISPSDTKIRNLDELKNYIGSDGTCKCGLSCPLRLEVAFSFDPKVTNMTAEDEKENLALLHASGDASTSVGGSVNGGGGGGRNDSSSSSSSSSSTSTTTITAGGESDTRLLCNHKRKIPKAEDSPLISSTRDDLGDFGEKLKKRRLSGNECLGEKLVSSGPFRKDSITTSSQSNNAKSSGNNSSGGSVGGNNVVHNVPVPFCQQSPDTTTQTPQTEMSPASSVCSDGSTILFSSSSNSGSNNGGNRSLTSTPTPTLSSSSTSSTSSVSAAAATTTKAGNSPSQGQGHCDQFVWPSPPVTLATGNLSSPTVNAQTSPLSQLAKPNQTGTFWLSPTNSIATFSTGPSVSSGSNSLTLNYVQSPNSNTGTGIPTIINSNSTSSAAKSTGNASVSVATSVTTVSTAPTTTTGPSSSTTAKKPYQPFSAKTVKRPSSPCPNVDVRQLPLEQNRPPPVSSSSSKISPLLPSTTTTAASTTITSLSTLPVVTNPNILFTVTPPLVTTNKTEIVSLSTPTLPILPLLTTQKLPTVGPIDTTCGAPTIVTTLQPNTGIFSTIDANTLYPTVQQNKESPLILPITSKPSSVAQQRSLSPVVKPESIPGAIANSKKNYESGKGDKETISSSKTVSKDGKESKAVKDGERCPLQLAQDILNRFEKKSGDKKAEAGNGKSNNDNGGNNTTTKNINSTTSGTKLGTEEKEKAKEKATKAIKSTKDGNNSSKPDEKCNKNETPAASVAKIDSSSLSSTTGGGAPKAEPPATKSTNESAANNKNSSGVATESKQGATSSTPDIVVLPTPNDKTKISVDPSRQAITTQQNVVVGVGSSAPITNNATIPLNTLVASSNAATTTTTTSATQLPQQPPPLADNNTIITSQTPVMSTTPLILKDGLQLTTDQGLTLTTSVSGPIPTISLSAVGNQIIHTSGATVPCTTTLTAGGLTTFAPATTNQIILQPHQATTDPTNGANSTFITTSTAPGTGHARYPILQTIQPLFLNSAGPVGGPLIISQPTQHSQDPTQGNPTIAQQSFIYDQNGTPTATIDATGAFQSVLQPATTTMVLDPSICAGNPNLAGGKKKKKRLSKKQQQQQAQLQLQQQFILQQIQAQQQQAAAAAFSPLTIFPQSFNLGPQGFSLQPTMNFFQTPTFLTLPNLILNPADGTLFIQPSTPLPTATTAPMQQTTMKLGNFPLTSTTQIPQNPQNIAPKKDGSGITTVIQNLGVEPLKPATTPGLDPGSDDSRQNPTPDSSTNDLQLGLINMATGPTQPTNTITLNIPTQTTTTVLHNASPVMNKKSSKSRTVSSSSTTVKRILPQKQILPKIDSTTPSTTENAN